MKNTKTSRNLKRVLSFILAFTMSLGSLSVLPFMTVSADDGGYYEEKNVRDNNVRFYVEPGAEYTELLVTPDDLSYLYPDGYGAMARNLDFKIEAKYDTNSVHLRVTADADAEFSVNNLTQDDAGNLWSQTSIQVGLAAFNDYGDDRLEFGIGRNSTTGEQLHAVFSQNPKNFNPAGNFSVLESAGKIVYEVTVPFNTFLDSDTLPGIATIGLSVNIIQYDGNEWTHTQLAAGITGGKAAQRFAKLTLGEPTDSALIVSRVDGIPGDDVPVSVEILSNPGIAGYKLVLEYDPNILEYQGFDEGLLPITTDDNDELEVENGRIVVVGHVTDGDVTADGILFTINFKVKDEARDNSPLTLSYEEDNDIGNTAGGYVNPGIENGFFTFDWDRFNDILYDVRYQVDIEDMPGSEFYDLDSAYDFIFDNVAQDTSKRVWMSVRGQGERPLLDMSLFNDENNTPVLFRRANMHIVFDNLTLNLQGIGRISAVSEEHVGSDISFENCRITDDNPDLMNQSNFYDRWLHDSWKRGEFNGEGMPRRDFVHPHRFENGEFYREEDFMGGSWVYRERLHDGEDITHTINIENAAPQGSVITYTLENLEHFNSLRLIKPQLTPGIYAENFKVEVSKDNQNYYSALNFDHNEHGKVPGSGESVTFSEYVPVYELKVDWDAVNERSNNTYGDHEAKYVRVTLLDAELTANTGYVLELTNRHYHYDYRVHYGWHIEHHGQSCEEYKDANNGDDCHRSTHKEYFTQEAMFAHIAAVPGNIRVNAEINDRALDLRGGDFVLPRGNMHLNLRYGDVRFGRDGTGAIKAQNSPYGGTVIEFFHNGYSFEIAKDEWRWAGDYKNEIANYNFYHENIINNPDDNNILANMHGLFAWKTDKWIRMPDNFDVNIEGMQNQNRSYNTINEAYDFAHWYIDNISTLENPRIWINVHGGYVDMRDLGYYTHRDNVHITFDHSRVDYSSVDRIHGQNGSTVSFRNCHVIPKDGDNMNSRAQINMLDRWHDEQGDYRRLEWHRFNNINFNWQNGERWFDSEGQEHHDAWIMVEFIHENDDVRPLEFVEISRNGNELVYEITGGQWEDWENKHGEDLHFNAVTITKPELSPDTGIYADRFKLEVSNNGTSWFTILDHGWDEANDRPVLRREETDDKYVPVRELMVNWGAANDDAGFELDGRAKYIKLTILDNGANAVGYSMDIMWREYHYDYRTYYSVFKDECDCDAQQKEHEHDCFEHFNRQFFTQGAAFGYSANVPDEYRINLNVNDRRINGFAVPRENMHVHFEFCAIDLTLAANALTGRHEANISFHEPSVDHGGYDINDAPGNNFYRQDGESSAPWERYQNENGDHESNFYWDGAQSRWVMGGGGSGGGPIAHTLDEVVSAEGIPNGFLLKYPQFIGGGEGFGGEGPEKLFDRDTATKYGADVTDEPFWAEWKYARPHIAKRFIWATGNDSLDHPRRMGDGWTLSGSTDGDNWVVLYTGSADDYYPVNEGYFKVDLPGNNTAYQYYRLNADDGADDEVIQLSEVGIVISTTVIYGDTNGDKALSIADVVALARHIAGITPITGAELEEAADVNGDGRVNIADLIRLARYMADVDERPLGP